MVKSRMVWAVLIAVGIAGQTPAEDERLERGRLLFQELDYDQAADLVNGALQIEPERTDLLTKLCEIYFVWGNRDAFIDAAGRLKTAVGDGDSDHQSPYRW